MMLQDLQNVISLAGKVLKCSNVTHTNICFTVNNMFVAIGGFVDMLEGKNIETEDASKIISLAQSVADDQDIKWDNVAIHSVMNTLGKSAVKSSNLGSEQADNTIKLVENFKDKLQPKDPNLVIAVDRMLDTFHLAYP